MPAHKTFPFALMLALAGCASSSEQVGITIDPPDAGVYLNGVRVNQGSKGVYEIDFSRSPRAFLQLTAYGYVPETHELTQRAVQDQINRYGEYSFTLKQER
ncbi:MAG: hypothetical protein KDE27_26810 [Planctomycetes bacterium]|nr:hypothetical protein [Planctomycetota bacterium]